MNEQQIKDAATLAKVFTRALQKAPRETLLSGAECDAAERFCIDYAARCGVTIKPNATPKPWAGAKGEKP